MKSDSVFWRIVADGGSVTGDFALSDVERSFSPNQETITAEDSVSGEGRALISIDNLATCLGIEFERDIYLVHVE